jgi:hypothetical protein
LNFDKSYFFTYLYKNNKQIRYEEWKKEKHQN